MADESCESNERRLIEEKKENIPPKEEQASLQYDTNIQLNKNEMHQTYPVSPRENLINTAVHFLQNPRVRSSPLSQKRAFLLKKGLTTSEVNIAIEKAGIEDLNQLPSGISTSHSQSVAVPVQAESVHFPPPVSVWTKWQSISSSFVVVGVACYSLYRLYKVYLRPWLFDVYEEDKISRVEQHLAELSLSLSQLKMSLSSLESSLNQQQEQICTMLKTQVPAYREENLVDPITLSEIKSEISSIKSLLLSRRQFPATPMSNPSIPTWQMPNHQNEHQDAAKLDNLDISPARVPDDAAQIAGGDSLTGENEIPGDEVGTFTEDGH